MTTEDRGEEIHPRAVVQPLSGREAKQLTSHPADDREPAFAPDGRRIAFRSDREGGGVFLVSTDGGDETKVAEFGRRPRFSPDGTRIAYWVGDIGGVRYGEIWVASLNGGGKIRLQPDFHSARYPIWSDSGGGSANLKGRESSSLFGYSRLPV